jgi:hypothetical protein
MRDLHGGDNLAKSFGTGTRDCFVSFAGSASAPVLIHNLGVASVSRSGTGVWVVTLSDAYLAVQPDVKVVGDKTRIHDITIDSFTTTTAGVTAFTFSHFASASGSRLVADTASDGASPAVTFNIAIKCWSRV